MIFGLRTIIGMALAVQSRGFLVAIFPFYLLPNRPQGYPSQSVADPSQSVAGLSNVLLIRPEGDIYV